MNSEINFIAGTNVLSCQGRQIQTSHPNLIIPLPTDDALENSIFFKPVDQLNTGDYLIGINNQIYQVKRCSPVCYDGPIITIQTSSSENVDHIHPKSLILVKRRVQSLSEFGGWSSIPLGHFQRARELRTQMTPPEWKLWGVISNEGLGVKFRAQHPIGPYIVDFYARKAGLVIEVDGEIAHGTPEQKANDQTRDAWLSSTGLKVLHYPASDVFDNIEGVIADIKHHLQQYVLEDMPQAQWRFSKNITSSDAVYLTKDFIINQVEQAGITHFQTIWYKVILNAMGNIITQTLIFKATA